jgi:hypothetical protein
MRSRLLLALAPLALAAVAAPVLAKGGAPASAPGAPDPLVVHEWGTFTSVQGKAGIVLEGLQHEEEPLPDFVYSRAKVRECPLRAVGWKGLEVPAEHVTQKMETPVIYFHAKTPRRVNVRVDFVKGLLTQWYPVSDLLGPPEGPPDGGPLDLSKVDRSFLQWDVDLSAGDEAAPAEMPAVAKGDPWGYARDVDAMWVRTVPRKGPERRGPTEADRFLFYRGLGTFELPFRAEADESGGVSFRNDSAHTVAHVVAIEVAPGGEKGRYGLHSALPAGAMAVNLFSEPRDQALHEIPMRPWKGDGVEELKGVVVKLLVDQGMNRDEARAMVATWSRSWFLAEGTRVMFFVPRPLVDRLLPLKIEPAPSTLERALVGRIELVTPANLAALERAVKERGVHDAQRSAAGQAALDGLRRRLGRFFEANLRAVMASTTDVAVREHGRVLLAAERDLEPR